ncbi:hypothetical protein IL306_003950 [Fusarium sp. DS 682]|nr:hypothetical protein IL306_003950 [Fusarium sp. DS 682]
MAPTRVGLVGLAPIDILEPIGGNWGVISHLKPILESPQYDVVAVCNSSVESARKSIEFHKLPDTVKAYGNPEDLANDSNVDLVVVSVNVAKHFILAQPALQNGKKVIVEWPLGATLKESEDLAALAASKGLQTAVGLQGRADPLIVKVKEILDKGAIGKVTSSVVMGCTSALPADIWLDSGLYYLDMDSGGNEFYINFGHFLDTFIHTLGDFETVQSTLKTQHPIVPIFSMEKQTIVDPAYKKTAPDHMLVQGVLTSGAVAAISFRKAKKPVDDLSIRWLITGTEGEIEVTVPEGHFQMGPDGSTLRMRVGKEGEVEDVSFKDATVPEHVQKAPPVGRNTARVYEAFGNDQTKYADFESALKTHKLLDQIARDAKYI